MSTVGGRGPNYLYMTMMGYAPFIPSESHSDVRTPQPVHRRSALLSKSILLKVGIALSTHINRQMYRTLGPTRNLVISHLQRQGASRLDLPLEGKKSCGHGCAISPLQRKGVLLLILVSPFYPNCGYILSVKSCPPSVASCLYGCELRAFVRDVVKLPYHFLPFLFFQLQKEVV